MEDSTVFPDMLSILKRIYRDVLPTTKTIQEEHLGEFDDYWKESKMYNKGQCYPQHVFYTATQQDLRDLQDGYLWWHKDKIKKDEFNRDVPEAFRGFDLCSSPMAAFISMCYQCNKGYVKPNKDDKFFLLVFKLDHGYLPKVNVGDMCIYYRQGSLTCVRLQQ